MSDYLATQASYYASLELDASNVPDVLVNWLNATADDVEQGDTSTSPPPTQTSHGSSLPVEPIVVGVVLLLVGVAATTSSSGVVPS